MLELVYTHCALMRRRIEQLGYNVTLEPIAVAAD
jgi:hypothetical protein